MPKNKVVAFVNVLSDRTPADVFNDVCRQAREGEMGFGGNYLDYGSLDLTKG